LNAVVDPRRTAYFSIARFCIANGCWSLVPAAKSTTNQ